MDTDPQALSIASASDNMKPGWPLFVYALAAFTSALTTIIAVFVWSFFIVYSTENGGSDAGRVTLGQFCILCMYAAVPCGILNALIISPSIALPLNMKSKFYTPVLLSFIGLLILTSSVVMIYLISAYLPSDISGHLNFYLLFLSPFLIPPLIVGSLAYSYCKLILLRKLNKPLKVYGQAAAT